jgi:hypothetical protein
VFSILVVVVVGDQMSAVAALVELFFIHEKSAYEEEIKTDAILDGKKDENEPAEPQPTTQKSKAEEVEETVAKCKYQTNELPQFYILCYKQLKSVVL